ncbi:hypothetical protein HGRIS_005798 [Hohenbuehelia grisea]|uniref:Arrestin-like N-terminal domain-containing protein n=1 Tax=Hohenbuehelia grisea TaxID=104357 RepID=A0ABR3JY61_9AGAR
MSTTSLPSYVAPVLSQNHGRAPSYNAERPSYERRIAVADHREPRALGLFVKQSKSVALHLFDQEDGISLPVYSTGDNVKGEVRLSKPENVTNVEVKIEGRLRLKEIAEGGTTTAKLCLDTDSLWLKAESSGPCPAILPFSLQLPNHFECEGETVPLPPTYDVKLSGVPGFNATIEYSISVLVDKPHSGASIVPLVKTTLFGSSSNAAISTHFQYYPRTRPATAPPPPLLLTQHGFSEHPEWQAFDSMIHAKSGNLQDITTVLYIPKSRVFCMNEPIPFHVMFRSSAISLASFMPYCPSTSTTSTERMTKIQLLRQSTVDVRNTEVQGTKTDMWRLDAVGEGIFRVAGDGPDFIAYSGEITIDSSVKVAGFKAAGLSVKDCIVLSMTPPEPQKSPFGELRLLAPIQLTTDAWAADGAGSTNGHGAGNGANGNGNGTYRDDDSIFKDPNYFQGV